MTTETLTRSLSFAPSTLNREARTVDIIALSGYAAVLRRDRAPDGSARGWYEELDGEQADLSALIGGPLLRDHRPSTDHHIGVVDAARVDTSQGEPQIITTARFSTKPAAEELFGDVSAGILTTASLGYAVDEWTPVGKRNGLPVFRATRWRPRELSLTPCPADAKARVRTQEDHMTTTDTAAPADSGATINRAALNAEIRSIARLSGLGQAFVDAQIDADDVNIENVRAAAFAEMQRRSGPALNTTRVEVLNDPNDPAELVRSLGGALACRLAPAHVKPEGRAREFAGWTLLDMAAELARARGDHLDGRNRHAVVDAIFTRSAHSTSDFPLLLENAVNKAMLPGYQQAAPTYRTWSAQRAFADHRAHRFLRLGDFPGLTEITAEGGEPTYGTVSENRETVTPKEFGTGIVIGRRALISDDLGALASLTGLIGARVAAEENRLVYAHLLSNPTLADSVALFHASHGNLPTAADITVDAVAAAVKALRSQKSLDGVPLNIVPRYLVIGPDKELAARKLLAAIIANQASNVNPWSGMLELVVDANITGNKWFVFADPGTYPVIVHGYVAGTSGPAVRSELDFDTRALKVAVGLDFGYGAVDYRGALYNAGA